jgi:hypothetical protein
MKRLLVLLGAILVLTAFDVRTPDVPVLDAPAAVLAAPITTVGGGGCDIFCWEGGPAGCPDEWHDAFYLPEGQWHLYNANTATGPHNDNECYSKTCEEKHGPSLHHVRGRDR